MTTINKATAVLFVDEVAPTAAFFERAGFTRTIEVPEGDGGVFTALAAGSAEVMVQSRASLAEDMPDLVAPTANAPSFLFIEVGDIEKLAAALAGDDVFMPRRQTFYGATEIGYRVPGGHFATFAQFKR